MSTNTVLPLEEAERLSPTTIIQAYVIDATSIGGAIIRICNESMPDGSDIVWQGSTYARFPVKTEGWEFSSKGELPRPKVTLSNIFGVWTALNINYQDLVRAKFIRKRFFYKHLIQVPQPSSAGYPDDIYFISRKISQNKIEASYELTSSLEIDGLQLPNGQVFANLCRWKYRSPECSFTGKAVADRLGNLPDHPATTYRGDWNDSATYNTGDYVRIPLETNYLGVTRYRQYIAQVNGITGESKRPPNKAYWFEDECSKRISDGCRLRFPLPQVLPFGGYPGTSRLPDVNQV